MNAVVLAGGAATRLHPLTLDWPAALLPVANRPVVEHLLDHLVRHRVREVVMALHHCPYPIEAGLGDGTRWGLRLRYALERTPLGTAGAVRRVAARWSEPFLVAAGTALTTADISKAAAFHQLRGAVLTLIVVPADGEDGDVDVDDEGGLAPPRRPVSGRFATTGLALVSPAALAELSPATPADLVDDLLPRLLAAGLTTCGYVTTDPGRLVRTPGDLLAANHMAIGGELPGLVLPGFEVRPGVRLSRGALVHPGAAVRPPVLVGVNAVIGRGAVVERSVVGEDVIVGGGSTVRHSVLLPRTHVGRGLALEGALVDRERLGRAHAGSWTRVSDPRILGDTRVPLRPHPGSLMGRLLAMAIVAGAAPLWLPVLAGLAVESGGRPLTRRRVVGARGDVALLRRVASRGRLGRLLSRLGLARAPHLWNVVRGDLHWVGTAARSESEWGLLAARGQLPLAPPGLVTLADLTPMPLRSADRLALDRLYAAARSRRRDARLLLAFLLRRLGLPVGALPSELPRP